MAALTLRAAKIQQLKPTLRLAACYRIPAIIVGVNLTLILIALVAIYYCTKASSFEPHAVDPRDNVLSHMLSCMHKTLRYWPQQRGGFWQLNNYIVGASAVSAGCADHVTYVVAGSVDEGVGFFRNLPALVRSWQAPISAGLYAPGDRFNATLSAIQYARNCIPEAELVRRFVSFHLFFPADDDGAQMPASMPHTPEQAANWEYNCQQRPATEQQQQHWRPFPVHVALNMARREANTHFVLLSTDAAYVPHSAADASLSISQQFLRMQLLEFCHNGELCKTPNERLQLVARRRLFVPPLRAIDSVVAPPESSTELDVLQVQWDGVGHWWQRYPKVPVFISDRNTPWFDERLPLEKEEWHDIAQPYAMCLLDYQLHPFADGFVVLRTDLESRENPHVFENKSVVTAEYLRLNASTLKTEYLALYGSAREEQCRYKDYF